MICPCFRKTGWEVGVFEISRITLTARERSSTKSPRREGAWPRVGERGVKQVGAFKEVGGESREVQRLSGFRTMLSFPMLPSKKRRSCIQQKGPVNI